MIYVTGDTHGDLSGLKARGISKLKKGDYLIICGDFGFLWDGSAKEKRILNYLGRRRYSILFIEGTHDNLDLLKTYPTEEWNGGLVRRISKNLLYLERGGIYNLDGKTVFTFGGGESDDADTRTEGVSWWQDEMPTFTEIAKAEQALQDAGNTVDYIITHQSSLRIHSFLNMEQNKTDHLGAFFDRVATTVKYKKWFFGSYHLDKSIPPYTRAIYREIVPVE